MTMFPAVRASNLNGRPFDLPGDFEGERNLVILAFQREQQALVDSWSPAIANLLARYADLCFYELPTISRGNLLFRAGSTARCAGAFPTARHATTRSPCTWTKRRSGRRLTSHTRTPSMYCCSTELAAYSGGATASTPLS